MFLCMDGSLRERARRASPCYMYDFFFVLILEVEREDSDVYFGVVSLPFWLCHHSQGRREGGHRLVDSAHFVRQQLLGSKRLYAWLRPEFRRVNRPSWSIGYPRAPEALGAGLLEKNRPGNRSFSTLTFNSTRRVHEKLGGRWAQLEAQNDSPRAVSAVATSFVRESVASRAWSETGR